VNYILGDSYRGQNKGYCRNTGKEKNHVLEVSPEKRKCGKKNSGFGQGREGKEKKLHGIL
jgi:hypothetical protein